MSIWPQQKIEPGQTWKFGKDLAPDTVHVRAIVDETQIIIRRWSRAKQRWKYSVEHPYFF